MRFSALIIGAFAISATLYAPETRAADIALNAVSYFDLPQSEAVTVETFDDSDATMVLQTRFIDELRAQGYTVTDNARLILSFVTRDTTGTWSGGGPNRLIEFKNSDDHTGTEAPDVRLNIYDNRRGGILNPKRDAGITEVAPSQYRIEAALEDRSNGRRLWEGWSVADIGASDNPEIHAAMVKPIISSIGKTVRDQRIPLP